MTDQRPTEVEARQPSRKKKRHGRRQHWPALLARFPKLFWRRSEDDPWDDDWPVVRPENLEQYPLLAAAVLELFPETKLPWRRSRRPWAAGS